MVAGWRGCPCCGLSGRWASCDGFGPCCILWDVDGRSPFAIELPAALLDRARRREPAACEEVCRVFEAPVYSLALRMLGDVDTALDVLQETLVKVFTRLPSFRGEAPFWGWVRRIAVNECLMHLRSRGREDPAAEAAFDADLLEHEGPLPPVAAEASRLAEALARVPARTRAVLWLYHVEGYTHEEIGALFGQSASFSKSQLARGTRRLRELLCEEEIRHV
ncbi:MAG: hypothetical protein KatS3mg126_0071 [Lysobacteraceae bacterium]|nr:MAG: hypothetical protein KatS3mg126_0071 [Xanthomonadaceae bacterium]